ncbi:uncharacterized protein METZ01_LOCUS401875 [marine metagenome]|uniref:Uncharacterized protein n=1 Tax=marine metagenome TaxID=408172 RepID=A0A382VSV6_9ZZZZ
MLFVGSYDLLNKSVSHHISLIKINKADAIDLAYNIHNFN